MAQRDKGKSLMCQNVYPLQGAGGPTVAGVQGAPESSFLQKDNFRIGIIIFGL